MATAQDTTTQLGDPAPTPNEPLAIKARVITPIVFWASLVPWASDTMDAEAICPSRKPRVRIPSGTVRVMRLTRKVPSAATRPAMTGDSIAGNTTLDTTPCHWTPELPEATSVAPTTPP